MKKSNDSMKEVIIGHLNVDFKEKNNQDIGAIKLLMMRLKFQKVQIINNISTNKHDMELDICFTKQTINAYNFYPPFSKNKIIWTTENIINETETEITEIEKPLSQMSISEEI